MGHHMYDWDMPFNGFHFGFGGIFMWIFWVIVLAIVIFLLVKYLKGDAFYNIKKDSPLEIAKRRYANGEITKKEFDEIKKNLQ